jgi:uncharacterized protein YjbJ (UPF0337 family)
MDDQTLEGTYNEGKGRLKDAVGGLTGDTSTQAQGKIDQGIGKVQRMIGDLPDQVSSFGEQVDEIIQERPMMALLAAASLGYVLSLLIHRK